MSLSNPPNPSSQPPPPPPPPIRYDLAAILKAQPHFCRVSQILRADLDYLHLVLTAQASFPFAHFGVFAIIECVNAVDYSVRPPNPGLLMGGPPMKFHEEHPLLANIQQDVPNSDGMEIYDPPVKFGVLVIDQTYVIAGQFALRLDHGDRLQNVSGWKDPERQTRVADLQRGLDWLEPFRLSKLKQFPTRSVR